MIGGERNWNGYLNFVEACPHRDKIVLMQEPHFKRKIEREFIGFPKLFSVHITTLPIYLILHFNVI